MAQTTKQTSTLKRYFELCEQKRNFTHKGIFYAFSKEQFEDGYAKVKPYLADGEKLVKFMGGGFGTHQAIKEMQEFFDKIDEQIKTECNPQEIYDYEYDNYECEISYEGDENPIRLIYKLFGEDIACSIKRRNTCGSIDNIKMMYATINLDEPLFYITKDGSVETPYAVAFDFQTGECSTVANGMVFSVQKGFAPFFAPNNAWYGMSARYSKEKNILYRFHI